MKRTILSLACALAAPLAFAQTSTTTTQTTASSPTTGTTTTETTTTSTTSTGTVTTFTPGSRIYINTGAPDPVAYLLGKTVQYVNRAGKTIDAAVIKPGAKVQVIYDKSGNDMVVNRVVVDQD